MNKTKYLLTTLSLFIMLPSITYAECTKEEINHFKEIEDDYKVSYEFNKETKDYNITFTMPYEEIYSFSYKRSKTGDYDAEIENDILTIKEYGYQPGEMIVEIIGSSETCNSTLKTIRLKLAKYNSYSEDPLCSGIEEFVLCQPTYEKEIDYDTFVSRVNTYKKARNINDSKIDENDNNSHILTILNFIKANLFNIIIISAFIIITITTVIISVKSVKKSRRLE